jgi:hypothetical protein
MIPSQLHFQGEPLLRTAVPAMEPYWTETVSRRYAAFLRAAAAAAP